MIVQINESGLEALMLEMLPQVGSDQYENIPMGCYEFMKELAIIDDEIERSFRVGGYKRNNIFNYWVDVVNQLNLDWAGRCDILLSFYAGPFINESGESAFYKKAVIIEFKKGKIDSNTINQVLRYKRYVNSLGLYHKVETVVVGTDVADVDFVLESLRDELSVWTCNYKADGIKMSKYKLREIPPFDYDNLDKNGFLYMCNFHKRNMANGNVDSVEYADMFKANRHNMIFKNLVTKFQPK